MLVFSPYGINPLHPRLDFLMKFLSINEIDFEVVGYKSKGFFNKVNLVFFGYFDLYCFFCSFSKIKKSDSLVYVQDLRFLLICIVAKLKGCAVIYESLDNNAFLKWYRLVEKHKWLKIFFFIPYLVASFEKSICHFFVDDVIVNSDALGEYFNNKANVIYYCSPFEGKLSNELRVKPDKTALLYLGSFEKMKGAIQMIDLANRMELKLFVFGSVVEDDVKTVVTKNKNIIHKERMSTDNLYKEINKALLEYRLLGLSLTQPVNISNATQEINKDIDYMALGFPIVGNSRSTTGSKIKEGCGLFIQDFDAIQRIVDDKAYYVEVSNVALSACAIRYSQSEYYKKMKNVLTAYYG